MRRPAALLVAISLIVLAAIPASAAARPTVQITGSGSNKTISYEAGAFDGQNDPQFVSAGPNVQIAEFSGFTPAPITAGPGCTQQSSTVALCPTSGVVRINIVTKGGNDDVIVSFLSTSAINTVLDLGADADSVSSSHGNDTLIGGDGPDELSGGPGNDTLHGDQLDGGGNGDDELDGDEGNDVLRGGRGDDNVDGRSGDDTLDGGFDSDEMIGGLGVDTADYSSRTKDVNVTLCGNPGAFDDGNDDDEGPSAPGGGRLRDDIACDVENAIGGSGDDDIFDQLGVVNRLEGRGGADHLRGIAGDDTLHGGGSDDFLDGGEGDDTLIGSTGADGLSGGEGSGDLAFYADHADRVEVSIGAGDNDGNSVDGPVGDRDNVFQDVENVLGGPGDDLLDGDADPNVLDGGPGADFLRGFAGIDTVSYASRIRGVVVTLGVGVADEGNATDDSTTGTGARDRIDPSIEVVAGGSGDDNLTGDANANTFQGNAGSDRLDGAGGDDSLDGGIDPDTMIGGDGADEMSGGEGSDTVLYTGRADRVSVNLSTPASTNQGGPADGPVGARDTIAEVENATGGNERDTLIGSAAANVLLGGSGGDNITSGGPLDLNSDGVPDDVDGDQVKGEAGNDTINSVDSVFPPESPPRGAIDDVSCGTGTDIATVDLRDTPPGIIADCESFTRAAVDQHPGVRISRPRLLTDEPGLVVSLKCPGRLDRRCKGELAARYLGGGGGDDQLAGATKPQRFLASRFYRVPSGGKERVRLDLSQRDINRILDAKRVRFIARELDPLGRPKLSSKDCTIGKSACRIRVS